MKNAVNYTRSGSGKKVLFHHGLGADLSQAHRFFQGFEGIDLICPEALGHGHSLYSENSPPSFLQYSNDVLEVLDKESIDNCIFGGISMGSGISLHIALTFPERVDALILVRPAWLDKGRPANLEILLDIAELIGHPGGKRSFENSEAFLAIKNQLPKAATSIMGQFSRAQGSHTSEVLDHMVNDKPFDRMADLTSIDIPTLIIGNDDDPLHPWEMAEAIHQAIPGSKLEKVVSRYIDDLQHKKEAQAVISAFLDTL
ncbi:MAG: alpha/beta hydrolase [Bacteroidia bacterium]|nr:alpha/beta hydrolase [Bacteroidia bacterium]